jgi:hypothetical protein
MLDRVHVLLGRLKKHSFIVGRPVLDKHACMHDVPYLFHTPFFSSSAQVFKCLMASDPHSCVRDEMAAQ